MSAPLSVPVALPGAPGAALVSKLCQSGSRFHIHQYLAGYYRWNYFSMVCEMAAFDALLAHTHTGSHLVLFCICTYILVKRGNRRQLILLFVSTAMFLVATVDITMTFNMVVSIPSSTFNKKTFLDATMARLYPKNPLFVKNK